MNIQTNKYTLRKVKKSDDISIFNILSNEKVVENLNLDIHTNIEDTRILIQEYLNEFKAGNKYPFAIIDKVTNVFIGVFLIKLDLYDDDCFEFTIYIDEQWWNKGVYSEVLPYMTKFVFEEIKTGNFRGFVKEKNIASSRVLEKNKFKLEKVFEVSNIEGRIKSYLITREMYNNIKEIF